MNLKFWKKKTTTPPFSVTRTECLTASIHVGVNPNDTTQYIYITAIDNQRALELFKQVREELKAVEKSKVELAR